MKRVAFGLAVVACASAAGAEGVAIDHQPVGCIVAGKHPQIVACFSPKSELARARVYLPDRVLSARTAPGERVAFLVAPVP